MMNGKKIAADFEVVDNIAAGSSYFKLVLQASVDLPGIRPGQFAQVRVDNSKTTFLRRPFSIHYADASLNRIELLINKVGDGSRALSLLRKGDTLNVILPLGNGFGTDLSGQSVLLAGGGVGIAPMLYLGKVLAVKNDVTFVFGFRSSDNIIDLSRFESYGKVRITTEDGSAGEKGFVTDHSVFNENFSKIYVCGPTPMMKAVSRYAKQHSVKCEVSLENKMACGLGACLCCVTETNEGHKCVCTDGPVFDINDLPW